MSHNLAAIAKIVTASGSKSLTDEELASLVDGVVDSNAINVSGKTLVLVCDLGARYNLDIVKYYRDEAGSEGIKAFGKQSDDDVWKELTVTTSPSKVEIDLEGSSDKYRLLKIQHEVSSGTASVYELEVLSSDEEVKFGSTGSTTKASVQTGNDSSDAESIPIKNLDSVSHEYYVLIDAEKSGAEFLEVSQSGTGPFFSLYENSNNFPNDWSWGNGSFSNTQVTSNKISLVSGTQGTYYTPVIDIQGAKGKRLYLKTTSISGSNRIDLTSPPTNRSAVSVRLSSTVPTGGWSDGQLAESDPNWNTQSGTLEFVPYVYPTILEPRDELQYFQAKIEFESAADGETPVLEELGFEEAIKLTVPAGGQGDFYVKSLGGKGKEADLLVWYFESRAI